MVMDFTMELAFYLSWSYGWIRSKLMCGEKGRERGYEIGMEKCVVEVVLSQLVGLVGEERGLSCLMMMVILEKMETVYP